MIKYELLNIIKNIIIEPPVAFHVLKHFSIVGESYIDYLLSNSYSLEEIENILSLPGSIFNPTFAKNVDNIIHNVLSIDSVKIHLVNNSLTKNLEISVFFHQNEFPNGIGWDCLISKENLTEQEINNIKIKPNGDYNISTIERELIPTSQMNIIVSSENMSYKLVTVFPGKLAPPFPNKKTQTEKQYIQFINFWDSNVFIESPNFK